MISNFLWMLNYIREHLLEAFILPELNISYWDFCIYLAIIGVVIVVLVNAVKVSGGQTQFSSKENSYRNTLRERERVKADERNKIRNGSPGSSVDYDVFENYLNNK